MSTGFPTSLDTYTTKNNGDTLQPAHVNDIQDAVSALEAKVGVDGSSVATSHTKKIADLAALTGVLSGMTASTAELNKLDADNLTTGDLLTKGASALEVISAVAATQYLKSAGVSTKPAYSKLALRDTGVKVGTFSARSGDGSQAITGVGFTPSCVIVFAQGGGPAYFASWGFASLAASMCIRAMAQSGPSSDYVTGFLLSSALLIQIGTYGSAVLSSMDTDGFTLSWIDRTSGASLNAVYLALP